MRRVLVKVAGQVIADTRAALRLQEASYPAVLYIPRADVDMSNLQRTEHTTYCPYKGGPQFGEPAPWWRRIRSAILLK